MKTLTLIRHSKSSWKAMGVEDALRGLNRRGKRDASFMAKKFSHLCTECADVTPQCIISSSALRARLLAQALFEACKPGNSALAVFEDEAIYTFSSRDLFRYCRTLDNQLNSVVIVGHNPALTELINRITLPEIFYLDNLPTSAFVVLSLDIKDWCLLGDNREKTCLVAYDKPKNYFN